MGMLSGSIDVGMARKEGQDVSTQPHGANWWRATDGRYYPPHSRPAQLGPTPSQAAWSEGMSPSGMGSSHRVPREPLRHRWWFWAVLLVVAVAVVFGVPILA